MISNIIITDRENINHKILNLLDNDWGGAKNTIYILTKYDNLDADLDLYLPANIFFSMNAEVIRFIISNNIKLIYDRESYTIKHTVSDTMLDNITNLNEYTGCKLGGYKFLQKHQKTEIIDNNVFKATIDVEKISKYVNTDTMYKFEMYVISRIKTLRAGGFLYRAKLTDYISNTSIDRLLANHILYMEGKRYYLNNPTTYEDRLKEEGIL